MKMIALASILMTTCLCSPEPEREDIVDSWAFEKAFEYVLKNEGGFVDNPNDSGGATKYGVSLRFLQTLYELGTSRVDINLDGIIDKNDIRALSLDQAKRIFFDEFWIKTGISKISKINLAIKVFDTAVNIGAAHAIKILQRSLNIFAKNVKRKATLSAENVDIVKVDGIIGPKTLIAIIDLFDNVEHNHFGYIYITELVKYYNALGSTTFLRGWINRATTFPDF